MLAANDYRWIEATWLARDGTLYGWYHNEPKGLCLDSKPICLTSGTLTVPRIGAVRSRDRGLTWEELGIVLEAPAEWVDCKALNGFFAGGIG